MPAFWDCNGGRPACAVAIAWVISCSPHEDLAIRAVATGPDTGHAGPSAPVPTTAPSVAACILRHGRGFAIGSEYADALRHECEFHGRDLPGCDLDQVIGLEAALCIARLDGLLAADRIVLRLHDAPGVPSDAVDPARAVWSLFGAFDDGSFRTVEVFADDGHLVRAPEREPPPVAVP